MVWLRLIIPLSIPIIPGRLLNDDDALRDPPCHVAMSGEASPAVENEGIAGADLSDNDGSTP